MDGQAARFLRDLLPSGSAGTDFGARPDPDGLAPFAAETPGGILYVEDFDDPPQNDAGRAHGAPPASPPEPPAPPVFSKSDVTAAHEAGRQAGRAAALENDATLLAQLRVAALQSLADALAAVRADAACLVQAAAEEATRTLLALLAAALPALSRRHAPVEITGMMNAVLPGLRREPALTIRLHPDMAGFVQGELARAWPHVAARTTLTADASLQPADLTIAWGESQAVRDCTATWNSMRAALAPFELPSMADLMRDIAHEQ